MRTRIRGPQTAAALAALAAAAAAAVLLPDSSGAAFLYALPALIAALLLTWEEAVLTAVAGYLVFLGLVTVDGPQPVYPTVITLTAVCGLALVLAHRHRAVESARRGASRRCRASARRPACSATWPPTSPRRSTCIS